MNVSMYMMVHGRNLQWHCRERARGSSCSRQRQGRGATMARLCGRRQGRQQHVAAARPNRAEGAGGESGGEGGRAGRSLPSRSAWLATSVQGQHARRDRLDHWGARQAKLAARVCVQQCVVCVALFCHFQNLDAHDDSNPGAF